MVFAICLVVRRICFSTWFPLDPSWGRHSKRPPFFFAGKTAEGVGKTPGSCSKTQDFEFATPETWPSQAARQKISRSSVYLFVRIIHWSQVFGCVSLCFVGLRFVLFAKQMMMPQLKTYKLTFIASQKLSNTWWGIWTTKTYLKNLFSAGIWKTSRTRNMRLSNWESCPCYRGDTFKQSLKPRNRSECTWHAGW